MPDLPAPQNLIAGRFEPPGATTGQVLEDPNTGARLSEQVQSDGEQIERALEAAAAAHEVSPDGWAAPEHRVAVLRAIADAFVPHVESMAILDAATTGATIRSARYQASLVPHIFRQAAAELERDFLDDERPGRLGAVELRRRPLGPAALLSPWSAPAATSARKIAGALAAGCPCILKPSEWAPHSSLVLALVLAQVADLPPGTFQLLHGDAEVGRALVSDPRIAALSYTGGSAGGHAVAELSARHLRPVHLELGGGSPIVVLEDAAVEHAAAGVVEALTGLGGPGCHALGRLVVHEAVLSPLLTFVAARMRAIRLGHSLDPETDMGPLAHRAHWQRVHHALSELHGRGGHVLQVTSMPEAGGFFLAPALVGGSRPSETSRRIFGPVAAVHSFTAEDDAVYLANAVTPRGPVACVYSADEDRGRAFGRRLAAAEVRVNGVGPLGLQPDPSRPGSVGDDVHTCVASFGCTALVGVAGRPAPPN